MNSEMIKLLFQAFNHKLKTFTLNKICLLDDHKI